MADVTGRKPEPPTTGTHAAARRVTSTCESGTSSSVGLRLGGYQQARGLPSDS